MSLNLKNQETERLARELARLKGISLVAAVREALEEKLRQEKATRAQAHGEEDFAEWLMKISRETAPMMNDGRTSKELIDALYDDETGLPK